MATEEELDQFSDEVLDAMASICDRYPSASFILVALIQETETDLTGRATFDVGVMTDLEPEQVHSVLTDVIQTRFTEDGTPVGPSRLN